MPRARSSASDPVEIEPIETCAWSLMRITEPLPNCRSICPSAVSLEPLVQSPRDRRSAAVLVVEHEHADAPRLAIPAEEEARRLGHPRRLAQASGDRSALFRRTAAEERERDVQVVRRDDADVPSRSEGLGLPLDQSVDGRV